MISSKQHKLNTTYNLFLFDLIVWKFFNKRVEVSKKVEDVNKMLIYKDKIMKALPEIDKLDKSKIKSNFLLIDDVALIQSFKDTIGE